MGSLIKRVKDAWSVVTGKVTVTEEHPKPLVTRGTVTKTRKVSFNSRKTMLKLEPGEVPLRMLNFTDVEMGVYDTSMSHFASFILSMTGETKQRYLKFQMNGIDIKGTYDPVGNMLYIYNNFYKVSKVEVLIEMPEYQLVEV